VFGGTQGYLPTPPPHDKEDVVSKVKLAFAEIEKNLRFNKSKESFSKLK
jgi:hypothetical protein